MYWTLTTTCNQIHAWKFLLLVWLFNLTNPKRFCNQKTVTDSFFLAKWHYSSFFMLLYAVETDHNGETRQESLLPRPTKMCTASSQAPFNAMSAIHKVILNTLPCEFSQNHWPFLHGFHGTFSRYVFSKCSVMRICKTCTKETTMGYSIHFFRSFTLYSCPIIS